jgi:pimeloyl-ACP methyl ester carboxylesterase
MTGDAPRPFAVGERPTLRGESAGDGSPVVLCHGVTATRRQVLHGSRALERAGHRVIAYDARGHGESDPAPPGGNYGYPQLVADLERVVEAEAEDGAAVLAGHSMGAHTVVSHALAHRDQVAGIVVIGPTYTGEVRPAAVEYWDGLADALEKGGIEGFIDYLDGRGGAGERWRDSVRRFTRSRLEAQRDLAAVAAAVREVARSRPFGALDELRELDLPALVVASHDEADPGHPYAVAEAYAEAMPRARLTSEEEGRSPLAWQGGRLSREIAAFCEEIG